MLAALPLQLRLLHRMTAHTKAGGTGRTQRPMPAIQRARTEQNANHEDF
ncbi:hypothetical protein HMPREF0198_1587 [Cardiobacterium hominis ATCC 15826]|uniref:Uncharacterized protein n=1 Tax=Cardiobacterium hominis (strain ATCC 15826 / DSM 8339 / NCTC 10426 / 6573) TaxID=638300 RepID=C8NAQ9_CARH6|nr:hypothetical protein HMPREF0198_1587 [Cardiobacterium hominis ATCC 15826]